MTGPMFLVTISKLTSSLDCTTVPEGACAALGLDPPYAVLSMSIAYNSTDGTPIFDMPSSSNWIPCFEGSHRAETVAAVLGLLFFFPSATIAASYFVVRFRVLGSASVFKIM